MRACLPFLSRISHSGCSCATLETAYLCDSYFPSPSSDLTTSQYVKYYWQVYIVSQKHLNEAMETHMVIHYAKTTKGKRTEGHVHIRSFLTHKEYNNPKNWDREFGKK
jgi:hypothetical protein